MINCTVRFPSILYSGGGRPVRQLAHGLACRSPCGRSSVKPRAASYLVYQRLTYKGTMEPMASGEANGVDWGFDCHAQINQQLSRWLRPPLTGPEVRGLVFLTRKKVPTVSGAPVLWGLIHRLFWRPESPMDSKAGCLRACATNLIPGPMGAISQYVDCARESHSACRERWKR
jgi:hypothetical protein